MATQPAIQPSNDQDSPTLPAKAVKTDRIFKIGGKMLASNVRVSAWKEQPDAVVLHQKIVGRDLNPETILDSVKTLAVSGINVVLTPALTQTQAAAYLSAGFRPYKYLDLLNRPLHNYVSAKAELVPTNDTQNGLKIRNARRRHYDEILTLDSRAFIDFWQYDRNLLGEAIKATTTTFFRVAKNGPHIVGYSVAGTAQDRGYLQRLAVDPRSQNCGVGTALLDDALNWLIKRGARTCSVNTQQGEQSAVNFYTKNGFVQEPSNLVVLIWAKQ